MTPEQLALVWSHLHRGAEFSVRNQDGWWGLRGSPQGVVAWSRTPYAQDPPDAVVTFEEARAMIGRWDFAVVCAHLSPALSTPTDGG
jgi:hypothetical protein